jgi:predicted aldo/keto reductase-like oxidoreductase
VKCREFGKVDLDAPALGFGCIRLPNKGPESDVDEPKAI